jgi:hypothetical protein
VDKPNEDGMPIGFLRGTLLARHAFALQRPAWQGTSTRGPAPKVAKPRGISMNKIAWCLWLVLAMPSLAFGWQRRDGTYYCTVKFAGGLEYDNSLKEWQGAILKPSRNFVMKLTFRQAVKGQADEYDKAQTDDHDEYDVTITEEGDASVSCLESREKFSSITRYGFLECSRMGLIEYKFNFINHRFIEIYKGGYINGANDNNDTPKMSGGVCTLAQSIDAPKPSKNSLRRKIHR